MILENQSFSLKSKIKLIDNKAIKQSKTTYKCTELITNHKIIFFFKYIQFSNNIIPYFYLFILLLLNQSLNQIVFFFTF
jgi:hypothetical protein